MTRSPGRRVVVALLFVVGVLWLAAAAFAIYPRLDDGFRLPWTTGPSVVTETPHLLHAFGDPNQSGSSTWPATFDATPAAYDLDGDGVDEIIGHSNDTHVYVYSSQTGRQLASIPTSFPEGDWYVERVLNEVVVARLRPDEAPSLVITDHAAFVAVWRFDGSRSTADAFEFEQVWERRLNDCFFYASMDAAAAVADLDGDGVLEILAQTEDVGLFALEATGDVRWHHCWAGGNSAPLAADLNEDGLPEVVFASDAGLVLVANGTSGAPFWTFNAQDPRYGVFPASISVSPTMAELDGAWPRELVFTARHAPRDDPSEFGDFHLAIFAIHQSPTTWQGEVLWVRQPEWAHPLSYTHLIVRDVDADGDADIFGMDWNTVGHNPGHWEPLRESHVFRLTAQGEDVWVRTLDVWWSNKDIAVADSNGDGEVDVLVNGQGDGSDGFWRLSAASGQPQAFLTAGPWKILRGPLLVDVGHDGPVQLLCAATSDRPDATRHKPINPSSVGPQTIRRRVPLVLRGRCSGCIGACLPHCLVRWMP